MNIKEILSMPVLFIHPTRREALIFFDMEVYFKGPKMPQWSGQALLELLGKWNRRNGCTLWTEYCHARNIFTSWAGGAEDCIADTSKLLEGDSSALGTKGAIDLSNAPGIWVTNSINEKKFSGYFE